MHSLTPLSSTFNYRFSVSISTLVRTCKCYWLTATRTRKTRKTKPRSFSCNFFPFIYVVRNSFFVFTVLICSWLLNEALLPSPCSQSLHTSSLSLPTWNLPSLLPSQVKKKFWPRIEDIILKQYRAVSSSTIPEVKF